MQDGCCRQWPMWRMADVEDSRCGTVVTVG